MSAKARATICAAMSCCGSRSPSAPLRPRCHRRWPGDLTNRPGTQQPRQKGKRCKQRMAPLPWLELDFRAGVAIDFPRDVVGAAGEGEAGLGEAEDRNSFAPALKLSPSLFRGLPLQFGIPVLARKTRCLGELPITFRLCVDDQFR